MRFSIIIIAAAMFSVACAQESDCTPCGMVTTEGVSTTVLPCPPGMECSNIATVGISSILGVGFGVSGRTIH